MAPLVCGIVYLLLLFIIGCLSSESHLIVDFVLDWKSRSDFRTFSCSSRLFPSVCKFFNLYGRVLILLIFLGCII